MKKLIQLLLFVPFLALGQPLSKSELIKYFDDNRAVLDPIEGLWTLNSITTVYKNQQIVYKKAAPLLSEWGIKRLDKLSFKVIDIGEGSEQSREKETANDFEAFFESSAIDGFYTYKMNWKKPPIAKARANAILKNSFILEYSYWLPRARKEMMLGRNFTGPEFTAKWDFVWTKKYPKLEKSDSTVSRADNNENWTGNGSGIIISKSGYIVTNNHVIEDAIDIEVEFILNDEVKKFTSEVIKVDKTNDLAILKISDINFNGVEQPPYNFKSRAADVGTKVYTYGYPMALSLMGKEIKVTDGIISAKSGFQGDITTYQITAAIQGGSSGGPLFDEKGNLLGINSSGINKEIADNVGYTIKSNYILNLIDVLPESIDLPSNTKLESLPLTEQIKEISKFVVLIKVK